MTTQITEYSKTDAALAELKSRWAIVPDANTAGGYELVKEGIRELTGYRTSLETLRKDLKAPIIERGKLLDSEAKRITASLKALEAPLRSAKKAVDEREAREKEERIQRLQAKVDILKDWPQRAFGKSSEQIREIIDRLGEIDTAHDYYDLTKEAMDAQAASLVRLDQLLDQQVEKEAQEARQAEERKRMAEEQARLNAERAEMIAKQEAILRQQEEQAAALREQQRQAEEVERKLAAKRAELEAMEQAQQSEPEAPKPVQAGPESPKQKSEPMFKMPTMPTPKTKAEPKRFEPSELTISISEPWQREVLEALVPPADMRALATGYEIELVIRRTAVAMQAAG